MHVIMDKVSYQLTDAYPAKIWPLVNEISISFKELAALAVIVKAW